jgi:hypothetical protein
MENLCGLELKLSSVGFVGQPFGSGCAQLRNSRLIHNTHSIIATQHSREAFNIGLRDIEVPRAVLNFCPLSLRLWRPLQHNVSGKSLFSLPFLSLQL